MKKTPEDYTVVHDSARYARTIETRFVKRATGGALLVAAIYAAFSPGLGVLAKGIGSLLAFGALALLWRARDRQFPCYRCRRKMTAQTFLKPSGLKEERLVCDSCRCYVVVGELSRSTNPKRIA